MLNPNPVRPPRRPRHRKPAAVLGPFKLYPTLHRSAALVQACAEQDVNLEGARVYLSDPQGFALIEHPEGHATLADDRERCFRFFPSVADAQGFIRQSATAEASC